MFSAFLTQSRRHTGFCTRQETRAGSKKSYRQVETEKMTGKGSNQAKGGKSYRFGPLRETGPKGSPRKDIRRLFYFLLKLSTGQPQMEAEDREQGTVRRQGSKWKGPAHSLCKSTNSQPGLPGDNVYFIRLR